VAYTNRNLHERNCPSLVICYIKREKIADSVPEQYHLKQTGRTLYFSVQDLNSMTGQIASICVCTHAYTHIHTVHIYMCVSKL